MISQKIRHLCCGDISKIENYDRAISDYKKIWHCHHKKETPKQGIGFTKQELIRENLYFNRPPEELIFLTPKKHRKAHVQYAERLKTKTTCKITIKGIVSFADFLNKKNEIQQRYNVWIVRHPEKRAELEKERNKIICDLLDEYEQKETKSFSNVDKAKEFGIKLDVKLLCKQ